MATSKRTTEGRVPQAGGRSVEPKGFAKLGNTTPQIRESGGKRKDSTKSRGARIRNAHERADREVKERGDFDAPLFLGREVAEAAQDEQVTGQMGSRRLRTRDEDAAPKAVRKIHHPAQAPLQGRKNRKRGVAPNHLELANHLSVTHNLETKVAVPNYRALLALIVGNWVHRSVADDRALPEAERYGLTRANVTFPVELWPLFDRVCGAILRGNHNFKRLGKPEGWDRPNNWPAQGPTTAQRESLSEVIELAYEAYWHDRDEAERARSVTEYRSSGAVAYRSIRDDSSARRRRRVVRERGYQNLHSAISQLNGSNGEHTGLDDVEKKVVFYKSGASPLEQSSHAEAHAEVKIDTQSRSMDLSCGCLRDSSVSAPKQMMELVVCDAEETLVVEIEHMPNRMLPDYLRAKLQRPTACFRVSGLPLEEYAGHVQSGLVVELYERIAGGARKKAATHKDIESLRRQIAAMSAGRAKKGTKPRQSAPRVKLGGGSVRAPPSINKGLLFVMDPTNPAAKGWQSNRAPHVQSMAFTSKVTATMLPNSVGEAGAWILTNVTNDRDSVLTTTGGNALAVGGPMLRVNTASAGVVNNPSNSPLTVADFNTVGLANDAPTQVRLNGIAVRVTYKGQAQLASGTIYAFHRADISDVSVATLNQIQTDPHVITMDVQNQKTMTFSVISSDSDHTQFSGSSDPWNAQPGPGDASTYYMYTTTGANAGPAAIVLRGVGLDANSSVMVEVWLACEVTGPKWVAMAESNEVDPDKATVVERAHAAIIQAKAADSSTPGTHAALAHKDEAIAGAALQAATQAGIPGASLALSADKFLMTKNGTRDANLAGKALKALF